VSLPSELNYHLIHPRCGFGRHAAVGMAVPPYDGPRQRSAGGYTGRHRAILEHPFVVHGGDERRGCGFLEGSDGEGGQVRCGFYRQFHPTMADSR
jgi:hypothetical protein